MQSHDQDHWFELAIEDVERRLRRHRRGKPGGTSPAPTSWGDVASVYRDIAGRNLWGVNKDTPLHTLLDRLVRHAVGCLPEGQVAELSARSSGRSWMQAMDILLPFVENAPLEDISSHIEALAIGCLNIIKGSQWEREDEGQDRGELEDKDEAIVTQDDKIVMVDAAYRILSAVIQRGVELERVRVRKSILTGVVSKIGSMLTGGKRNKKIKGPHHSSENSDNNNRSNARWTPIQVSCLKACLMQYPQALKHAVDGLGEVAARENLEVYVMLARVGGTAEGWSARGDVLMASIDAGLDVLLDGLEADTASGTRGYPSPPGILDIPAGEQRGVESYKTATFADLLAHVENLLHALRHLVTSAFPVPVPMPIARIVALVRRLLVVDSTRLKRIERVGRTTGQVTRLGIGLPHLQITALHALRSTMRVCGGHLIPYIADVNASLRGALETMLALILHNKNEMPEVAVHALYTTVRQSLRIDGVAGAHAFEDVLVELTRAEIYGSLCGLGGVPGEVVTSTITGKSTTTISLLATLRSLFYHAASALKHDTRIFLEDVTIHIAKIAHQLVQHTQRATTRDSLQENAILNAALHTLEASITVPSPHRPTHAAEALCLFRAIGPHSTVAASAIRHLEAAMHPKSLDFKVPLDNAEAHARHQLGIPTFWLMNKNSEKVVIVKEKGERNGKQEEAETDKEVMLMGKDMDVGRGMGKDTDEQQNNHDTGVAAAVMEREKKERNKTTIRTSPRTDPPKRFKVSAALRNQVAPSLPIDTPKDAHTPNPDVVAPNADDAEESDDYFDMIDSGGEDSEGDE